MKAIIIAAGRATRLLPLTKEIPQCLLEVNNKPILERHLDLLNMVGIKDISVICGHLANKVEAFCQKLGVSTLHNPFYDVSGMAMTLWIAKESLKRGFILLYSDVLFDPKIVEGLLKNKGDICLAIKKDGLREEAEKVIERGGIIENVIKDKIERGNSEFIGIAKFSKIGAKKLIEELNKIAKINLNASFTDVIARLIKKGEVVTAYDTKDMRFVDIDFPDDLKKVEKLFK